MQKKNEDYLKLNRNSTNTIGIDPVLGDAIANPDELLIIRGGWTDSNNIYYNETKLNKEYFKIENHPKLNKPWMTTTKKNVSIIDKYNIIIKKLNELNIIPLQ